MNNISIINLAEYQRPIVKETKRDEWVSIGEKNDYYDWLIERYRNSPTHNTVINNIVQLIYGGGLSTLNSQIYPNDWAQFISLTSEEDVRNICGDLYLFGKANIQVHYNDKHEKITAFYHTPANLIRPEKCDENGDIVGYYFCNDWSDTRKFIPERFDAFGTSKSKTEILEIRKYSFGKKYFSDPEYLGCLSYAVLEEEISDYLINVVQNRFSGTKVVNFNNGETDLEKMRAIKRDVESKLTGAKGNSVIVSFNANQEYKTTVDDIPLDNAPEYYKTLSEECTHKILRGHKVTTPLLLGIATQNGFSSNSDELKNGFILFDNMVIRPMQSMLVSGFEKILNFNQNRTKLYFKTLQPLQFQEDIVQVPQQQATILSSHESDLEDYELIDEREVNYDNESELDELIEKANNPTLTMKAVHFVKTGTAYPKRKSSIDGQIFLTRYRYDGEIKEDTREFCKAMLTANKLYRLEDIRLMSEQPVNPGWGPHGTDTYDIFKYKGGGNCHHVWLRQTYRKKGTDLASPLAKVIPSAVAKNEGEIIPTVDRNAFKRPVDMPNNGFLPK